MNRELIYRDATFSGYTRDRLAPVPEALEVLAAIEADVLAHERGAIDDEQLATRIANHCRRGADPHATREAADAVRDVVARWDENDATQFSVTTSVEVTT